MTKTEINKKSYKLLDQTKSSSSKEGGRLLYNYFKPYYIRFIIILIILFIGTTIGLIVPMLVRRVIDVDLAAQPPDINGLLQSVLIIVGLSIVAVFTLYFQIRFTGELGQNVLFNIRKDLFNKLQELPLKFYAQNKSGDIIARLTSDVEAISSFLTEGFIRGLGVVFNLLIVTVIMFSVDFKLTIVVLGSFLIMVIILLIQGNILRRLTKKSLDIDAGVSNQIQDILNGFRVIKSYGKEEMAFEKFNEVNKQFFKSAMYVNAVDSTATPLMNLISALFTVIIIILALDQYLKNEITAGSVIAYVIYVGIFYGPLRNISSLWKNIQAGLASSQRIYEILSLKTNIIEVNQPYNPKSKEIKGQIEFNNVYFAYDGEDHVLEDINLMIGAGETLAIVGPTGGGKTTFVNLIARLYDTTKGNVLIDGKNIKDWNLGKLRGQIGYLLQDTFLFEDTIFNNLRYNNPKITTTQAEEVLNAIGAESFIKQLPKGIKSKLRANGSNISAGQRQMLAIARLILRDPKILILDEATSNIDTQTEQLIQQAIEYATKGRTAIVIAHRLSTIKNADKVVLIENNKISESGTIDELIKQDGTFAQMWNRFNS